MARRWGAERWWLAALVLALTAGQVDAAEPWPEKMFNPAPAAGDVVLPMPCGGSMVFRRVAHPADGPLDDVLVEAGDAGAALSPIDGRRIEAVAGGFTDPARPGERYYLLAKYELTEAQRRALLGDCARPTIRTRLPAVEMSWFDAVDLGRRYTEWLMAEAPDALPGRAGMTGFVRLPTEAEWEYAARGGAAVATETFLARHAPMPDGPPSDYAWHQGSRSAGGKLHPVGLLKPDPLGLHDMLGNAAELTQEPFRLNRRGRPHGQAGGLAVRGGDITTPADRLGSADRRELPPFDARTGRPATGRTIGARFAIGLPAVTSQERLGEISAAWERMSEANAMLARIRGEGGGDPVARLETLAAGLPDEAARAELAGLGREIREVLAESNAARDRALRAVMNAGALSGYRVRGDALRLAAVARAVDEVARPTLEKMRKQAGSGSRAKAMLAEAEAAVAEMEARRAGLARALARSTEAYVEAVVRLARDYPSAVVARQAAPVRAALVARGATDMAELLDVFLHHVADFGGAGAPDGTAWTADLTRTGGAAAAEEAEVAE